MAKPGAEKDLESRALNEVVPPVGFVYDDAGGEEDRGDLGTKVRPVDVQGHDADQSAAAVAEEGDFGKRAQLCFVEGALGLDVDLRELPDPVPLLRRESGDGE